MDKLLLAVNKCLANTFVLYFKAHSYHWNVEGIYFKQYHDFFGSLYEELHGAVDPLAEHIRVLDSYAPATMEELYKFATIAESKLVGTDIQNMLNTLLEGNDEVLSCLDEALTIATGENRQGLANFLADRIEAHEKHKWMLKASLKGTNK